MGKGDGGDTRRDGRVRDTPPAARAPPPATHSASTRSRLPTMTPVMRPHRRAFCPCVCVCLRVVGKRREEKRREGKRREEERREEKRRGEKRVRTDANRGSRAESRVTRRGEAR